MTITWCRHKFLYKFNKDFSVLDKDKYLYNLSIDNKKKDKEDQIIFFYVLCIYLLRVDKMWKIIRIFFIFRH